MGHYVIENLSAIFAARIAVPRRCCGLSSEFLQDSRGEVRTEGLGEHSGQVMRISIDQHVSSNEGTAILDAEKIVHVDEARSGGLSDRNR